MTQHRKLMWLEALTVVVIAVLTLWSVRPLVEEWGTLGNFSDAGALYPWGGMWRYMALRPLHMSGYLLQWIVGGGTPIGVGIATLLVTLARYAAIRWAVTPVLCPVDRWIVATFGAILIVWPGTWLGRYVGAQISSVFFFLALGCSLRLAATRSWAKLFLGALSALAVLLFYQALAIAMLVAAVLCAALGWRTALPDGRMGGAVRAGAPFIIGLSAYAVYAVSMSALRVGTYETDAVGGPISPSFLLVRLDAVYASAFGSNALTAPLLLSLAIGFMIAGRGEMSPPRSQLPLAMLAVLALPALSLLYLAISHATDAERTLFPVSVGFVLLLIVLGLSRRDAPATGLHTKAIASLVAVALILSFAIAREIRAYWDLQSSIIAQLLKKNLRSDGGVLLKDTTGALGGLYTFYTERGQDGISRTLLQNALRDYGLRMNVSLCTPLGVDRPRKVASRLPVPAADRCEEADGFLPYDKVLVARWGPNGIIVAAEPSRQVGLGKPVRFDESGAGDLIIGDGWSGQEQEYRWSEGPTASLAVELRDVGGAELVLGLQPFLGGGLAAQRVRVAINGIEAGTWIVDRPDDYAVAIPPAALDGGRLDIVLSISDPTEPCRVMDSADCRSLGVAIRKLVIN